MIVYKYRSLTDFSRIYDILVNKRLHCSKYQELNDPFEGEYQRILPETDICGIARSGIARCGYVGRERKFLHHDNFRICSFSKSCDDVRMWSFYADGHKGVCIEIELTDYSLDQLVEVNYDLGIKETTNPEISDVTAKRILSRKSKHWDYEREVRLITAEEKHKIQGSIKKIFVGDRISELHLEMIRKIADGITIEKEILGPGYQISFESLPVS